MSACIHKPVGVPRHIIAIVFPLNHKMASVWNRQLLLNKRRSERVFFFVPVETGSRSPRLDVRTSVSFWRACFHMLSQGLIARSAALACCGEIRPKLMTLMLMRHQTLSAGLHRQARRGLDLCFFPFFFFILFVLFFLPSTFSVLAFRQTFGLSLLPCSRSLPLNRLHSMLNHLQLSWLSMHFFVSAPFCHGKLILRLRWQSQCNV